MTPERIAEIRQMPHDNWLLVHELLDAIEAANGTIDSLRAEVAELRAASAWIVQCSASAEGEGLLDEQALVQASLERALLAKRAGAPRIGLAQELALRIARQQGRDEARAQATTNEGEAT